jgi:hypothetical protein
LGDEYGTWKYTAETGPPAVAAGAAAAGGFGSAGEAAGSALDAAQMADRFVTRYGVDAAKQMLKQMMKSPNTKELAVKAYAYLDFKYPPGAY